jgi:hypothetical protein
MAIPYSPSFAFTTTTTTTPISPLLYGEGVKGVVIMKVRGRRVEKSAQHRDVKPLLLV